MERFSYHYRGDHFRLHTLFSDEWVDIVGTVKNQSNLQFFGLHAFGGWPLSFLSQLCAESVSSPIIFCLSRDGSSAYLNCICLYPAFPPPGVDNRICRALKPQLDRDCGIKLPLTSGEIGEATLFFETIQDTSHILTVILDMVETFPEIAWLVILVRRSSKLVGRKATNLHIQATLTPSCFQDMEEIKKVIAPVRHLCGLEFSQWYESPGFDLPKWEMVDHAISDITKLAYAEEWGGVCPELQEVTFFDYTVISKKGSEWRQTYTPLE